MKATAELLDEKTFSSIVKNEEGNNVLKSIADMVVILDKNFHIQFVNTRTCQLLKQKESLLLGEDVSILFPKNHKVSLLKIQQEMLFKDHLYNFETQFRVLGQRNLPVSLSFSVLKESQDSTKYLLIAKDIKQISLTNDTLKQKNKELETFVYRVSHDLKGPLASIRGLLELIEREDEDFMTFKHYIKLIKSSTHKLENTLSGLLEIGLSTSNKVNYANFNVRECIEDVMRSFEGYPGSKEVILLLSSNKDLDVTTEEKTFRSVMQNLIENSIKYRKPNVNDAVTKISARKYKNGIKIKVKDNGQGMDKQVQSRAFDMFYRGNQGSEGSGLGLFIVKSNVERLGGEIKIKSKADHGTEMWVYLPSFKINLALNKNNHVNTELNK